MSPLSATDFSPDALRIAMRSHSHNRPTPGRRLREQATRTQPPRGHSSGCSLAIAQRGLCSPRRNIHRRGMDRRDHAGDRRLSLSSGNGVHRVYPHRARCACICECGRSEQGRAANPTWPTASKTPPCLCAGLSSASTTRCPRGIASDRMPSARHNAISPTSRKAPSLSKLQQPTHSMTLL